MTAGAAPTERIQIQELGPNGLPRGKPIKVQFNPTSLQYTINNTAAQGSSRQRSRAVDESTAKLTLELVFDTTDSGGDVRMRTQQIAVLMRPNEKQHKQTPIVELTWGVFKFKGALDQYRETIDFFSSDGVPLRATLSLGFTTIAEKNKTPKSVFEFASAHHGASDPSAFQVSDGAREVRRPAGQSTPAVASALGDPNRARDLAAFNGIEDLRNGSDADDTLLVPEEPMLDGPLAFASGESAGAGGGLGAGLSLGATGGPGASAGIGVRIGIGINIGISASASVRSGGMASAGVPASAGAFARLRASRPNAPRGRIDVEAFRAPASTQLTTDDPDAFGPGGQVSRTGSSSLNADVGQRVSLRDRIEFED